MAKPSKKKSRDEPISVSEIYETIQARDFLRELWWDLISDIQEKPTYKRIKGMVNDVINNTLENFTTRSVDPNEELKRRNALTEISIMTYTLDTVISEVLYRRYQNEFENIVKNLIEDLLQNKTDEVSNPAESRSVFENIEKIFDKERSRSTGMKSNNHAVRRAKESQVLNSVTKVDESNRTPARKRGRPKKISTNEENSTSVISPTKKRKRGRPPLTSKSSTNASFTDKIKSEELDAESEISVGNLSIDSVSSVHTSELSSFEDTVSICSEDEGVRKHIPLKVANDMYLKGKLSQIYEFGKRSEKLKLSHDVPADTKNLTKVNISSSADATSPSRKVLPQRNRKPNSKYKSKDMQSNIKDYSSPPADTESSSSQDELYSKPSARSKRSYKKSNLSKGIGFKCSTPYKGSSPGKNSASKKPKANNSPLSKASTKRYDASDLYKPRTPLTGSNIGSRSAAATFFST